MGVFRQPFSFAGQLSTYLPIVIACCYRLLAGNYDSKIRCSKKSRPRNNSIRSLASNLVNMVSVIHKTTVPLICKLILVSLTTQTRPARLPPEQPFAALQNCSQDRNTPMHLATRPRVSVGSCGVRFTILRTLGCLRVLLWPLVVLQGLSCQVSRNFC